MGLAEAAGNSAWNCEQAKNGEWVCLNQDAAPAQEQPQPKIIKTQPVQPVDEKPIVSKPMATPVAAPVTPVAEPKVSGLIPNQERQPIVMPDAKPQLALPAQPEIDKAEIKKPAAATAVAELKPVLNAEKSQVEPLRPRVHITENEKPQLQKVEPVRQPAVATGMTPGWTCQSGGDRQNWNCSRVGPDTQGEPQVVAEENTFQSHWLTPTFNHSQELTFQTLRSEFQQDPWQNCDKWSVKKRKTKAVSAEIRENAITDVTADFTEAFEGEVLNFAGNVNLNRADQHLMAEKASYDTAAGTMDAQGNVLYSESAFALASESLSMNINNDEARLRKALFVAGDGPLRGSAEAIYRDSKDLSRYHDTAFTSCAPGNQDWLIHAARLKINRDSGQGSAKDAWLEFKGVPVVYTPYISFPVDNRRLSGFLSPNWGQTTRSGFYAAVPFYWNIAPNVDTTITPRYYSERGEMLTNKLRYLNPLGKGTFGAEYMPDDQKLGKSRYSFSLKDNSIFTPHLNSQVDLNLVSDKTYFNDLNNALGFQRSSYLPSSAYLNYVRPDVHFSTGLQHYQSVDPTISKQLLPYDVLPRVNFNLGHSFDGFPLKIAMENQYAGFYHPSQVYGQRLVFSPSVSVPLESSAGFFIPKISLQSAHYQLAHQNVAGLPADISRTLPIFSLDSGLVFDKDINFGGTPYTNIVEPRLFYLYIPRKDQTNIPVFDTSAFDTNFNSLFRENTYSGYDRLQDANQITLAATTRYIDNTTGLEPLKASLGQAIYFQDRTVTLNSANQPFTTPINPLTSKTSNVIADISGQINQHLSYATGAQWNTEHNSFARGQVGLKYRNQPDQIFDIGYRFRSATANPLLPASLVSGTTATPANISLTDVSFRWPLFDQWYALGRWQYSLNFDKTLESFIGLEKENCCWRLRIIGRRYINGATTSTVDLANLTPDTGFFVQLELKGLSGFGDDVDSFLRTSLNGYRRVGEFN